MLKSSFASLHACAAISCPIGHRGQVSYDLFDDCVSALLWFLSNDQLSRVTTPGKKRSFGGVCQGIEAIGTARVSLICYRAILPPCQKRCQSKDKVCVRAPAFVCSQSDPRRTTKPWWQAILASRHILMELYKAEIGKALMFVLKDTQNSCYHFFFTSWNIVLKWIRFNLLFYPLGYR